MQSRDEYEADFYGGMPFMQERDWRMPGNMPGNVPGRACCQGRINELLEEMERAREMQSDEVQRIIAEIRKVCGSIDGRGCMAIEGEADRNMVEMLLNQVLDRLDGDSGNWYRELVETLIWQELLRRKMRRRMPGRRRRY